VVARLRACRHGAVGSIDTVPPPLVRTCTRCHFTLPPAYFEGSRNCCVECSDAIPLPERVVAAAADHMLRSQAALHLLNLGLTVAAANVLRDEPWPTLAEARRMQSRGGESARGALAWPAPMPRIRARPPLGVVG
jgi:hypothetical protein